MLNSNVELILYIVPTLRVGTHPGTLRVPKPNHAQRIQRHFSTGLAKP